MADIVYNQRFTNLTTYDIHWIDYLISLGFTVDSLISSNVETYDYTNVKLFIVGAPNDTYVATHPNANFLSTLEIPIISMCRGASRNALNMSTASASQSVMNFRIVDGSHPISENLSGTILIGTSVSTHRISSLTSGTNLIMDNGTNGYAGIAERFYNSSSINYSRIHWGYHRADTMNQDGFDIFTKILEYLEVLVAPYKTSGNFISKPIDLTSLPNNLRINWVEDKPLNTSVSIETGTNESDSIPPITWVEQVNGELINSIPSGDLTGKYLWIKYNLSTSDTEVTPSILGLTIEAQSADASKIILNTFPLKRFNNVEGDITVSYNASNGNLQGVGGVVQSFTQVFTPTDLVRIPNPLFDENIKTDLADYIIALSPIIEHVIGDGNYPTDDIRYKGDKYELDDENISVSMTDYTIILTNITDIDP